MSPVATFTRLDRRLEATADEDRSAVGVELGGEVVAAACLEVGLRGGGVAGTGAEEPVGDQHAGGDRAPTLVDDLLP